MNDLHALTGAYAVDALEGAERDAFEEHLAECEDCRTEVAGLREAAVALTDVVATPAPRRLRGRVLTDAASTRPFPPVAEPVPLRRPRRTLPALAAAASVVLAIGVGIGVAEPWDRAEAPVAAVEAADAVFAAPDVVTVTEELRDGITVTVARSQDLNAAAVRTAGMPAAPDGHSYQLWLSNGDYFLDAGLMDHGNGGYLLQGDANKATFMAITTERLGGNNAPKGDVLAQVDFGQA